MNTIGHGRGRIKGGKRSGLTTTERDRMKELEREVRELKRANDPAQGIGVFRTGGARPPTEVMI